MAYITTEGGDYLVTEDGHRIVTEDHIYDLDKDFEIDEQFVWVPNIEGELLAHFRANPHDLYSMSPRGFEELISCIFSNQGFDVTLTPKVKDGGFDILAVQKSAYTGDSKLLIECKRYSKSNRVGVGIVRSLHGVVESEDATKGIVVTTSFFTADAKIFQEKNHARLCLSDYNSVKQWLQETIP